MSERTWSERVATEPKSAWEGDAQDAWVASPWSEVFWLSHQFLQNDQPSSSAPEWNVRLLLLDHPKETATLIELYQGYLHRMTQVAYFLEHKQVVPVSVARPSLACMSAAQKTRLIDTRTYATIPYWNMAEFFARDAQLLEAAYARFGGPEEQPPIDFRDVGSMLASLRNRGSRDRLVMVGTDLVTHAGAFRTERRRALLCWTLRVLSCWWEFCYDDVGWVNQIPGSLLTTLPNPYELMLDLLDHPFQPMHIACEGSPLSLNALAFERDVLLPYERTSP